MRAVFVVAAVAAAVALGACGGGGRSSSTTSPKATTTARAPAAAKRKASPSPSLSPSHGARAPKMKAYDHAYNALSYHAGALRVEQTVEFDSRPDLLEVIVPTKHFFCALSAPQRSAAIKAYYERAAARVRAAKLPAFEMIVGDSAGGTGVKHVFARVRAGDVRMTAAGLARRNCG